MVQIAGSLRFSDYRCFYREHPAILPIQPGYTAIIGPNNSGKSALLKSLYELRPALVHIRNGLSGGIEALVKQPNGIPVTPPATDPDEYQSERPDPLCSIEISIDAASGRRLVGTSEYIARALISRSNGPNYVTKLQFSDGTDCTFGESGVIRAIDANGPISKSGTKYLTGPLVELVTVLERVQYIGPYRNAINEGTGSHFDLNIGTGFIANWHNWKSGGNIGQNRAIQRVTEDVRQLLGAHTLEINASNELKTLQVAIDGRQYKLPELGAGLAQLIVVLGSALVKKPSIIAIDEPELHLHPALQTEFLTTLGKYATYGVYYSTHSMGLARHAAGRCLSIQRRNSKSIVREYDQTPHLAEFLGSLGIAGLQELGWDQILLVEGTHDVRVFQRFLKMLGKSARTIVLPLGGSSLINGKTAQELAEVRRLSHRIFAIIDSERVTQGAALSKDREAFATACASLDIPCLVTERRATENYFSDKSVKSAFGADASALPPYMKGSDHANFWGKAMNWLAAEQMSIDDLERTDLGAFLARL